jgi:hypothetical protein
MPAYRIFLQQRDHCRRDYPNSTREFRCRSALWFLSCVYEGRASAALRLSDNYKEKRS